MPTNKFNITCTTGESFDLEIPPPGDNNSFFAFSLPKAGSTLLEKVLIDVCAKKSIPVISPCPVAFRLGLNVNTMTNSLETVFYNTGYAYLGFRQYLPFDCLHFDMKTVNKLLLVRDPRDMVTSLYFSLKYSHTIPDTNGETSKGMARIRRSLDTQTIDAFAIEWHKAVKRIYERYIDHMIPLENVKIYKYEDIIFEKENWLRSMLDYLGEDLPEEDIVSIAAKHDIRPSKENPKLHVRQVTPGNYRKHLGDETTRRLTESFSNILERFGYDY